MIGANDLAGDRTSNPVAKEEHVKVVQAGKAALEAWRAQHPTDRLQLDFADLSGLELQEADLSRANLSSANLEGADLRGANLSAANLHRANLKEAKLADANLEAADLSFADLTHAGLQEAALCHARMGHSNLDEAKLTEADFTDADLGWASMRSAEVSFADFRRAKLRFADLGGVTARHARFSGADMLDADLSNADLRDVSGLCLDGHDIRGSRFSPRSKDPWSVVRRNYTGALLLFHFVFLGTFITPYMMRAAAWSASDVIRSQTLSTSGGSGESWPLWQLLLGWDKGLSFALTGAVMILYNLARAILTWWLAQLRDAEERSGFAPSWPSYRWCYWLHHHFMRYVFWLALASFIWHIAPWLGRMVIKPI